MTQKPVGKLVPSPVRRFDAVFKSIAATAAADCVEYGGSTPLSTA